MYALYARQSVDNKESISIENQLDLCRQKVIGHKCVEYKDKGFSGKNTERPAFQKMMEDIRKGEIEAIVVYKLDRISRSVLDFSKISSCGGKLHFRNGSLRYHAADGASYDSDLCRLCSA